MKLNTHKTYLMLLIAFSLTLATSPLTAQVYKVVDEDGNVTYTDRPPTDGSKPMDLPPLSIVEVPVYEKTARESAPVNESTETPLKVLRQEYRDFAIISPLSEESVWHPEGPVAVAWSVSAQLREGMKVTVFVDGKAQTTTTQPIIPVAGLERGEHTITAELKDAKNRRIASAEAVTFFIKQPDIHTNRARPRG